MKNITFLNRKSGLYLKETDSKGRGVFCTEDIKAGEELEVTPALILNEKATDLTTDTILNDYVFTTGDISKKIRRQAGIKKLVDTSCIVMGVASYCNHDDKAPNAEVLWLEKDGSLYYLLQATKDIPQNTEICTSYGDTWFGDRD